MSKNMIAGTASESGLILKEIPVPEAGSEQVLVKVHAAGINRADLIAATGAYGPPGDSFGKAIGMEWAGEIVAVGEGVKGLKIGDMVACSGMGGYAEYAVADMGRAIKFDPAKLPVEEAATLPLALMTAHNALSTAGAFKSGDSVLVHGASSAVGIAALRIARLLGASIVCGSSTQASKRALLKDFGADFSIDPTQAQWSKQVLDATEGRGVDVVVDMVTGPSLNEAMRATALLGRIVNVGRLGGKQVELDLDYHSFKRVSLIGVTFRSRSLIEVREVVRAMKEALWGHVEAGTLRLPLDRSFALHEAVDALGYMASNQHFGKLVIKP